MSKENKEELQTEPQVSKEEKVESSEATAEAEAVENEFNLLQEELASLK
ncbi:MAG: Protein GrpE, partial [Campylobacterota bacterium]|nr:Protein GrpE [Campylobacterota bacterium]